MRVLGRYIVASALLALPGFAQDLATLARQVADLRAEVAAYRLEQHERRARRLEHRLGRLASDRRRISAEDDEVAGEIVTAETQLATAPLDSAEREELSRLKNLLVTDKQTANRRLLDELRERENNLRLELDRERAAAQTFRNLLQSLSRPLP